MRLRKLRNSAGLGFCVFSLLVFLSTIPGCDRESESGQTPDGKTAPAEQSHRADAGGAGCEVASSELPDDLQWARAQLGEQFTMDSLPEDYAGCLLEPTGIHRSYVCADAEEVVADQQRANRFSLFVEVEGTVRSVISSTGASEEELSSALGCCEPFEAEPRFFGGDIDEFYRCGGVEFAFGKPARRMLRGDKFAVVMRHADFDLDDAVGQELGGEPVQVDALAYKLENKEVTTSVELLSGDTREAPKGQEFVSVYYSLTSERPDRASISHDRIELLDGGGKLFAPIPEARDDRSSERNGAPNAMMMLFQPGDSKNLKDVFLVPEGVLTDGFGIRFFGVSDEHIDRYVLGERRWLQRPSTETQEDDAPDAGTTSKTADDASTQNSGD